MNVTRHILSPEEFPKCKKALLVPITKRSEFLCTELEISSHLISNGCEVHCLVAKTPTIALRWKGKDRPLWFLGFLRRVTRYYKLCPEIRVHRRRASRRKLLDFDPNRIKDMSHEAFDYGYALASSFANRFKDQGFESRMSCLEMRSAAEDAIGFYDLIIRMIDDFGFDCLITYNGRFLASKAVIRAAKQRAIDYITYECASVRSRYTVHLNCTVHDAAPFQAAAEVNWERMDEATRTKAAEEFFQTRRTASFGAGPMRGYTQLQESGLLPPSFDPSDLNITVFTSSGVEFSAISPEWDWALFPSQPAMVAYIADHLSLRAVIWVRRHPNEKRFNDHDKVEWERVENAYPNVKVLPPDDPTSTYALVDKSDLVVVRNSTVGVEAVYSGTPAIVTAHAFYRGMRICYEPETKEEMMAVIEGMRKGWQPTEAQAVAALKYASFWDNRGVPFGRFADMNQQLQETLAKLKSP